MSLKKSKLDLLVRVRYSNPLPAPPCPPKLLEISTNPQRYARPEFLNSLANQTPLPMIVDADCGMPLDLSNWECLWEEGADDSELNPDPEHLPKLDPKDEFIAFDSAGPSTSTYANGNGMAGQSLPLANVSWLRKTEYTSRSDLRTSAAESQTAPMVAIDVSPEAQIRDIQSTFAACNDDFSLKTLRHPMKPGVTAIESYEVLPDIDIWPNQYDLFRFSERPGERALDVEDPRLDCAILRPMKSEHDSFLAYYLTTDDHSALEFKQARAILQPYDQGPEPVPVTQFRFVRDYETVKVEQEVPNEFLLVLYDGLPPNDLEDVFGVDDIRQKQRSKGAFYKNIERKMTLKKKRAIASEQYVDKWDIIQMKHCEMNSSEIEERDETLAEVVDPAYMMMRAEAEVDADGDVELEDRPAEDVTMQDV